MQSYDECQLPCLPRVSEGRIPADPEQSFILILKYSLAVPWNYYIKRWLKSVYYLIAKLRNENKADIAYNDIALKVGDNVRVRLWDEIKLTLDPFKELKGCAFLAQMQRYCGTTHSVFQVMERFLDERDYKVKKVKGVVLLDGVICRGTPAFGRCDRCCHLFWREEWLEKIEG